MTDFVTFLRARLDEDEAAANAANTDQARTPWGDPTLSPVPPEQWGYLVDGYLGGSIGAHCARWDPLRVLRDVALKVYLLDRHREVTYYGGACSCDECEGVPFPCETMRHVAAVYAGHPDYRQEWAP